MKSKNIRLLSSKLENRLSISLASLSIVLWLAALFYPTYGYFIFFGFFNGNIHGVMLFWSLCTAVLGLVVWILFRKIHRLHFGLNLVLLTMLIAIVIFTNFIPASMWGGSPLLNDGAHGIPPRNAQLAATVVHWVPMIVSTWIVIKTAWFIITRTKNRDE